MPSYKSKVKPFEIEIDLEKDALLTEYGISTLKDRYLLPEEQSPQENFARAACAFADDREHAQRLYNYASKLWFGFSTPILCNAGTERGLPISCFLNYVEDSCEGLAANYAEDIFLSRFGGGIGTYMGAIRSLGEVTSKGNATTGLIPFVKVKDSLSMAFQQGACYIPGTEVLTSKGFINFEKLTKEDLVAQVNDARQVSFVHPTELVNEFFEGNLIHITAPNNSVNLLVTPNHSMVIERLKKRNGKKFWSGNLEKVSAENIKYHRDVQHHVSTKREDIQFHFSYLDALKIAFQADGNKAYENKDGSVKYQFHFSKNRKIERLENILENLKKEDWFVSYEKSTISNGSCYFYLKTTHDILTKDFEWVDLTKVSTLWSSWFFNELSEWDGSKVANTKGFSFSTINEKVANKIQEIASVSNIRLSLSKNERDSSRKPIYKIYVFKHYKPVQGESISKSEIPYKGNVVCCEVPEGKLIVRYNGSVSVCGNTRRGSCAVYIDDSHPEIEEFIEIRRPTRAEDRRTMYLHHAINITDAFMTAVINDGDWKLIDPKSKKVKKVLRARELFAAILKARMETGEPYIHFIDTSNRALPQALKIRGLRINTSNLCNEIYLPTSPDRTAVCCLSSVNLEKYLEWKDEPLFIEDLIRMLDNVLQSFIDEAHPEMWRAVNSARKERSLGLGVMGWHSFLQSLNIPFESLIASTWNQKIFAQLFHEAKAASSKLADERGEAPDMKGTGFRNAHVIAIAPTASNSIICGETSPSIEPWSANGFNKKTLNGTKTYKNKYLEIELSKQNKNTDEVWHSIITNNGSVQHLKFLDDNTKDVFKTAFELDMDWVVEHASLRQKFIDQGQSVNLFFEPETPFGKIYTVHKKAWQGGLKGLYYLRSFSKKRAESGGLELQKQNIKSEDLSSDVTENTCLSCEG